mmetsp:Transcript_39093/g.83186  ORF Transcript_39093/g.83186 Transcript_39093/m.83186 type:complete len:527 (+) Transcript_39093:94-1674(+)
MCFQACFRGSKHFLTTFRKTSRREATEDEDKMKTAGREGGRNGKAEEMVASCSSTTARSSSGAGVGDLSVVSASRSSSGDDARPIRSTEAVRGSGVDPNLARELAQRRVPEDTPIYSAEHGNPRGGFFKRMSTTYNEVVLSIVRPPRSMYHPTSLGSSALEWGGREFLRSDFRVTNPRGLRLECSWWQPKNRMAPELPCVVYMHGNSSCRMESFEVVEICLPLGCTVVAFDFSGSGISQGQYVTLGHFEKEDCRTVLEYLRNTGTVSRIGLWGRSMGAATALLHASHDPLVSAMVLDSPFRSIEGIGMDLFAQTSIRPPTCMVKAALKMFGRSTKKRTGADVCKVKPIQDVHKCQMPVLVCTADNDRVVLPKHSREILAVYGGPKKLVMVEGDHNSLRPYSFQHEAMCFLFDHLCRPSGITDQMLEEFNARSLGLEQETTGSHSNSRTAALAAAARARALAASMYDTDDDDDEDDDDFEMLPPTPLAMRLAANERNQLLNREGIASQVARQGCANDMGFRRPVAVP